MDARYFSLMDLAIAAVPALAFGLWQLYSVNREIAKDKAKKEAAEKKAAAKDGDSGVSPP